MKRLVKFLFIPIFLLCVFSCSDDDDTSPSASTTTFKATLSGASEVPANASTATGNATLTFNNTTKIFTLTVNYSGMTATDAHVHKGAVGISGPAVFPITVTTSPLYLTSTALTTEQEADLKNNLYYINIHSSAYPDGEIRGQLMKQTTSGGGGPY